MNYTGLGRLNRYRVGRPLTDQERADRLDRTQRSGFEPNDALTTIRINSTYLEVVDRWYALKGTAVWMALLLMLPFLWFIPLFFGVAIERNGLADWLFCVFAVVLLCSFVIAGFFLGFRLEAFRWTHYPIRLNRKTRQVHAFRQDGSVLTASWDELFLHTGRSHPPLAGEEFDVRAHVLDADGETVRETVTLGYVFLGGPTAEMALWEYLRRYMEEPDGPRECAERTKHRNPVGERREGLVFGLARTFASFGAWPIVSLIGSPLLALNTVGRWIAMYTSKVPHWPAEVEAACQIAPDDPYCKDWCDNPKPGFWDLWWPLFCFAIGLTVVGWGAMKLVQALAAV